MYAPEATGYLPNFSLQPPNLGEAGDLPHISDCTFLTGVVLASEPWRIRPDTVTHCLHDVAGRNETLEPSANQSSQPAANFAERNVRNT